MPLPLPGSLDTSLRTASLQGVYALCPYGLPTYTLAYAYPFISEYSSGENCERLPELMSSLIR